MLPDGRVVGWISESGAPAPEAVHAVDDTLKAKVATRRLRAGEVLLWTGDWHNGRQLLAAVKRRVRAPRAGGDLAQRWRAQRAHRSEVAALLSGVVVEVDAEGRSGLRRAPDTVDAVHWAWGESDTTRLVPLSTLIGALGAAGWTRAGLEVPGLQGSLEPRYGVFSPTRHAYVELLSELEARGSVLDVGCGTGVLAFVLLQRGAERAIGTDVDPRSIDCATHNAQVLGLADRFSAVQCDLWQDQRADLVVFNAPWMPEAPATRLDRAVFDEGGALVLRWLNELPQHLTPGGRGALIVSDLPERLGLRTASWLPDAIEAAGLVVEARHERAASHRGARESSDPLHRARSAEQLCLWVLSAR